MINQLVISYQKKLFNSLYKKNRGASLKNKKAIEKQSHKDGTQALPLSRTSYTRLGRSYPEMQKTSILTPIYLSYSLSKGLHSFCPVGVRDRISSESPGTKGEAQVKGGRRYKGDYFRVKSLLGGCHMSTSNSITLRQRSSSCNELIAYHLSNTQNMQRKF